MKKSKKDKDYSREAILIRDAIKSRYGITARITRMWEFLELALSVEKFEILDKRLVHPNFETYMVDCFIDWMNDRDIEFSDIQDAILKAGDFTEREKLLLKQKEIEDRLWGIFLALTPETSDNKQT